jgi:hypothetical protein
MSPLPPQTENPTSPSAPFPLGYRPLVVFVTYEVMGQDISTLVNGIDSDLTSAS